MFFLDCEDRASYRMPDNATADDYIRTHRLQIAALEELRDAGWILSGRGEGVFVFRTDDPALAAKFPGAYQEGSLASFLEDAAG
jgi:lipid-binding SYLF domain-containing protein